MARGFGSTASSLPAWWMDRGAFFFWISLPRCDANVVANALLDLETPTFQPATCRRQSCIRTFDPRAPFACALVSSGEETALGGTAQCDYVPSICAWHCDFASDG